MLLCCIVGIVVCTTFGARDEKWGCLSLSSKDFNLVFKKKKIDLKIRLPSFESPYLNSIIQSNHTKLLEYFCRGKLKKMHSLSHDIWAVLTEKLLLIPRPSNFSLYCDYTILTRGTHRLLVQCSVVCDGCPVLYPCVSSVAAANHSFYSEFAFDNHQQERFHDFSSTPILKGRESGREKEMQGRRGRNMRTGLPFTYRVSPPRDCDVLNRNSSCV